MKYMVHRTNKSSPIDVAQDPGSADVDSSC